MTSTFPNGTRVNNDPDYHGAFRVGAAYQNGMSNRKWMVNYTHLSELTTNNVSGNFLWATVGRADFASSFENYSGLASSAIDTRYDRVDLLASEPLKWFDLHFAFLYGLEYAKIKVDENYAFAVTAGNTGTVTSNSSFTGIYLRLAFIVLTTYRSRACRCRAPCRLTRSRP